MKCFGHKPHRCKCLHGSSSGEDDEFSGGTCSIRLSLVSACCYVARKGLLGPFDTFSFYCLYTSYLSSYGEFILAGTVVMSAEELEGGRCATVKSLSGRGRGRHSVSEGNVHAPHETKCIVSVNSFTVSITLKHFDKPPNGGGSCGGGLWNTLLPYVPHFLSYHLAALQSWWAFSACRVALKQLLSAL